MQTGKELFSLNGHKSSVTSVIATPENKYIISSSEDETLRVWDFANEKELFKLADRDCIARSLAVTLDGRQVISLEWDKEINPLLNKIKNASSIKVIGWNLVTRKNKILFESSKYFDNVFLSNDGKYIALCFQTSYEDGFGITSGNFKINVVNLRTSRKYLEVIEHEQIITAFAITSDKKYVISGSKDTILKVWELESGKMLFNLIGHHDEITEIAVTPDAKQVISASKDGIIKIWSLETGKEIDNIIVRSNVVNSIAISSDSKQAIFASNDQKLKIFHLKNTEIINDDKSNVQKENNDIAKYDTTKYTVFFQGIFSFILVVSLFIPFNPINSIWQVLVIPSMIFLSLMNIAISLYPIINSFYRLISKYPVINSFYRLISKLDKIEIFKEIIKYDSINLEQTIDISNHSGTLTALAGNQSSQMIISASNDKTIRCWDIKTGEQSFILNGHSDKITSIALIPNSKLLISSSLDKNFNIWNLEDRKKELCLKSFSMIIYEFLHILLSTTLTVIHILIFYWTWTILNLVFYIYIITIFVSITVFTPCDFLDKNIDERDFDKYSKLVVTSDGRRLISGSKDKTIKVWNLKSRKHIFTLRGHTDWITSIAATPNSERVISGSKDTTLKLWNLNTRKLIHTFHGHSSSVNAVAITPDGLRVISGDSDGCLIIWDLLTRDKISTINAHNNSIEAIAVTSDGEYFISAGSDHTLKLWNLYSGEKIACFTADSPLTSCIIASDDLIIIAGDKAGQIHRLSLEGMMA